MRLDRIPPDDAMFFFVAQQLKKLPAKARSLSALRTEPLGSG
jgi:hypothetical protein